MCLTPKPIFFLYFQLSHSKGFVLSKIYHKRDDFYSGGENSHSTSYRVNISKTYLIC